MAKRFEVGDRVRATALLGCLPFDGPAVYVASVLPETLGTIISDPRARPRTVGATFAVHFDEIRGLDGYRLPDRAPATVWTAVKVAHIKRA